MTKRIPLPRGKFALVDDEDYARLGMYPWSLSLRGARRYTGGRQVLMHRTITNATAGMDVDHINGDVLDNRRSNLRVCDRSTSMANSGPTTRSTTGYKGVRVYARKNRYTARIIVRGVSAYLGCFKTPEDAARAYDAAARQAYGAAAYLNFPAAADPEELDGPSEEGGEGGPNPDADPALAWARQWADDCAAAHQLGAGVAWWERPYLFDIDAAGARADHLVPMLLSWRAA